MKITRGMLIHVLHRLSIGLVIVLGLLSIVGTGRDNNNDVNTAPVAKIDSPLANAVYQVHNSVTFTGSATDAEENNLTGSALNWVSSIDGRIGSGSTFVVSSLSKGTHQITLSAMDNKGLTSSTTVTITVNPEGNTLPKAVITNPATGATYNYNNFINFTGTGYDTEDLWLSGPSLVWYSNKDGQLGTGNSLTTNRLSPGTHIISLIATDSQNTSNTASITITIKDTQPVAKINYPATGATFAHGQAIPLDGTGTDAEDGNMTGKSLVWTASNYSGVIGYGSSISANFLPAGTDIIITLTAKDSNGLEDSDNITITITP